MPIVRKIALTVAALVAASACAAPTTEAAPKAAPRPVFKGTVTICYTPSAKSDPYGQYLMTQWNLAAAVKAAGPAIGKVKIVKDAYPRTNCFGDVWVSSMPAAQAYGQNLSKAAPFGVYKLVDGGALLESQITMGDNVGKSGTAAQRQASLVAALKAGIPR